MIRLLALASLLLGVAAQAAPGKPLPLGASMPAAEVKMPGVDGREVSLSEVRGEKGTLVVVTCNHCPWVVAWQERIAAIGNEYEGKGIGVVAVNPNAPGKKPEDGMEGMQARARQLGLKFPYAVDATNEVSRSLGATRTPEVFLFDAKGRLVYKGAVDDNAEKPAEVKKPYLRAALDALLAGEEIATKETVALGCTIKWR